MLDIIEDRDKHFIFRHSKRRRVGVLVGTVVYNSVHVKVKAIELGNAVLRDKLRYRGIPFRYPSEKLRDTHDCGHRKVPTLRSSEELEGEQLEQDKALEIISAKTKYTINKKEKKKKEEKKTRRKEVKRREVLLGLLCHE